MSDVESDDEEVITQDIPEVPEVPLVPDVPASPVLRNITLNKSSLSYEPAPLT